MSFRALTIELVAANPSLLGRPVELLSGPALVFRPLERADMQELSQFLESLSYETRRFWQRDRYCLAEAQELCNAIGSFDKLRMVAVNNTGRPSIQALVEFSFGIPESDRQRFGQYGLTLSEASDTRFGPCVRDNLRGTGLANALMPLVVEDAILFGKSRILLWGGVLTSNTRAIRFYEKHGFRRVGEFVGRDGQASLDMLLEIKTFSSQSPQG